MGDVVRPVRQEQPALVRVASEYRDQGVRFLGITQTRRSGGRAARGSLDHHVPYPSIDDQAGEFAGDLGYVGLPDTYIVDAERR